MGAQPDTGDHGERALRADEQLGEIGAGGSCRCATGADDRAVGQDGFEPDDHVFDLAVAGRVLAGATGRHPAADRREVEALWEVADRQTVDVAEYVLEVGAEGAGQDLDDSGDLIDVDDPRQCGGVEHDATEHRGGRTAHAAAAARDGERESGVVAHLDDTYHLVGRRRAHDHLGEPWYLSGERPVQCQWPPVAARLGDRVVARTVGFDGLADRCERVDRLFGDLDAGARESRVAAEQFNRWCWRGGHVRFLRSSRRRTAGGTRRAVGRSRRLSKRVPRRCSAATDGAAARLAGRSNRWARVRRARTSSSVVAISCRTAYTASARR